MTLRQKQWYEAVEENAKTFSTLSAERNFLNDKIFTVMSREESNAVHARLHEINTHFTESAPPRTGGQAS